MQTIITLLKFFPKNLLSFLTGYLSRLSFPEPLSKIVNGLFVYIFAIDMSEAEKKLGGYKNTEDVFTRALKKGSRPVQAEICSPADGILSISSSCCSDKKEAIQAKGLDYSLSSLVFGKDSTIGEHFNPAWFSTVYLAPHNYHRVHSPISGTLKKMRHIPGTLWPVNLPFVKNLPGLFVVNERLVFEIETKSKGFVYVVMVGALNVGRMTSTFWPELTTNGKARLPRLNQEPNREKILDHDIQAGQELGIFMLGSTVITVFDKTTTEQHALWPCTKAQSIRMGQSLLKSQKI